MRHVRLPAKVYSALLCVVRWAQFEAFARAVAPTQALPQ